MTDTATTTKVARLSVNLALDVAAVLRKWTKKKGISVTESIRRAIAVWNSVEEEQAQGNRLAVIERDGNKERIREVVLTYE